ncbi:MAG: dihydrodipicolinate synthase family protein [Verrucomicrobia bacterium]|nr:dihydrodipicolinate synthase family protein [Verrucomicrobiota bacterium]
MQKSTEKIESQDINGIIAAVNTPYQEDGSIDTDSLRRFVDHYLACGVAGFLVPAMAAEVWKLSNQERALIVQTMVDQVSGRVPIIGGASAQDRESRLENAKMLTRLGCDGVLVSLPFEDHDSFRRDIMAVAETNPGFLVIQDWAFKGFGIPVVTIVQLFEEIPAFKHLKVEVAPAGFKYTEVIKATGGKLAVSGGWASTQMIEGLDRGVNAFMSTILPDLYDRVYQRHASGKREEAKQAFNELLPVIAFSHQHLDISIHFNKRVLWRQGIFSTPLVRDPILPFDDYHIRVADELIEYALSISKPFEKP